ncbi:MAG TPA: hypothetical protein DDX68_00725 [Clostridium sp.]|nr:hypothetical protein [Clostridium sp.]
MLQDTWESADDWFY